MKLSSLYRLFRNIPIMTLTLNISGLKNENKKKISVFSKNTINTKEMQCNKNVYLKNFYKND